MNIAVTGGGGFIGSALIKALLKENHQIVSFDLKSDDNIVQGISGKYDVIYHLAVLPRPEAQTNPQKAIDVNIKGTINILENARKNDSKIVFTSASSVYGIPLQSPVDERTPCRPVSVYGASKLAAEIMVQTYSRLYSIDYVIFRFTSVYGPNHHSTREVIPAFLTKLRNNEPVTIYGSGEQSRDFVYIDDVVHFLHRAGEEDVGNKVFNLGSGESTSVCELLETMGTVTGIKPEVVSRPVELEERWEFETDLSKLKEAFGEVPETTLEEGIKKIWRGMKE